MERTGEILRLFPLALADGVGVVERIGGRVLELELELA